MSISTKPYFIRAIYEWCVDSGLTPYLVAYVDHRTTVPMQYVQNNEITLNVGANAVQQLQIDNDWVRFGARFSGVQHEVWIPTGNILSVFARETGEGMGFELEEADSVVVSPESSTDKSNAFVDKQSSDEQADSFLKIIK